MNGEERRQFVREHRTAVFGYRRREDVPAMSITYFVMAGEEILVSRMAERTKAKAVARDPKGSLRVLDEQWSPTYPQVYRDATVETDFDLKIAGAMAGTAMPENVRPMVAEGARGGARRASTAPLRDVLHPSPRHSHDQRIDPLERE